MLRFRIRGGRGTGLEDAELEEPGSDHPSREEEEEDEEGLNISCGRRLFGFKGWKREGWIEYSGKRRFGFGVVRVGLLFT